MWVRARQYSGRIVTVTNDKVFDEPVTDFTQEFVHLGGNGIPGIGYQADRVRAEAIVSSRRGRSRNGSTT